MRKQRFHSHRPDDEFERRRQRRYPAVDNTSQVKWSHDANVVTTAAQLMDVSREGLLVLVDDEPPSGVAVQIRLVEPLETAWVEANVMECQPIRQGPFQLRLVFRHVPPAGFIALAMSRDGERN